MLGSRISSTQRTAVVVAGEPHQHPPVIVVFMPDLVLRLVKWSGVSKVRMQALRRSLAVFGMQTGFHFAKIKNHLSINPY
jgi:hypothetical protein